MSEPAHDDEGVTIRRQFESIGQGHVFTFWKELDGGQRDALLRDLAAVNVEQLPALMMHFKHGSATTRAAKDLQPPRVIRRDELDPAIRREGESLISRGRVCAFTVAGGQGTRLGFDGPKGAFRISPIRSKPLFHLFAESIIATDRRYRCSLHWYIMTSPLNDAATREFFEAHRHFGLAPDHVHFFQQGVMPAFDHKGGMLLEEKHRLALSPDGHGGSLLALAGCGMLDHMARCGIDHISYFQVDNPLVHPIDPDFIGLHAHEQSEMSSKTVPKADDLERVGNFVVDDGRLSVIEYSDLPESMARERNPDGSRKFDAANIAIHVLRREFVERLTADRQSFALPWHRAEKKVAHVDLASGERIEPDKPNAIKLEAFIFDALPLARNPVLMETSREEEFSPVKNATGVDSVETARRDMVLRAARWLEQAGLKLPRGADGNPRQQVEISPLFALDQRQLIERHAAAARLIEAGGEYYLEA